MVIIDEICSLITAGASDSNSVFNLYISPSAAEHVHY